MLLTHRVSPDNTNRLLLFKETTVAECEEYVKHINTLCRQNAVPSNVKVSYKYRTRLVKRVHETPQLKWSHHC